MRNHALQDEKHSIDQRAQDTDADEQLLARIIQPLQQSRFWIQLFAGCLVFYGALMTVTGLGILVAWLPIWTGVLLFMATRLINRAYLDRDANALVKAMQRFQTLFTILGLSSVMLISMTLYLLKYAIDHSLL
jgi:hypothetical protein